MRKMDFRLSQTEQFELLKLVDFFTNPDSMFVYEIQISDQGEP